jgi:hypothetical protein
MAPYPTALEIQSIFSALSTGGDFFAHVVDDVDVSPLSTPCTTVLDNSVPFMTHNAFHEFLFSRVCVNITNHTG